MIEFNVGGIPYVTTIDTLKQDPEGLLSKMVSGEISSKKYKEAIFIDRDGQMFRHILDYLRNITTWTPPKEVNRNANFGSSNVVDLESLIREADFFGLSGMKEILESTDEWAEVRRDFPIVTMSFEPELGDSGRTSGWSVFIPREGPGEYEQFKEISNVRGVDALKVVRDNMNLFFKVGYRLQVVQSGDKDNRYLTYIFQSKD